jgi:hypothetical protein
MKFSTVLVTALLLMACASRTSDEEQLRELIDAMETAAEARDASDVLAHVAADYQDANGFDRTQLRSFLHGYFLAHPRLELLVDLGEFEFPADGLARVDVTVTSVELNDPDRGRLRVEFRRNRGEWQVSRADRVRP